MAISQQNGNCCPNHFGGFCLSDGTPIIIVTENQVQLGWINVLTGIFTPGAVPAGTVICDDVIRPLTCETDSITVCQPEVNAAITSVSASTTNVTLLAANPARKGAIFHNDSTAFAYIKFGATASNTSYSIRLTSQTFYELNKGYVGIIDCAWAQVNGAMRITEFT